MRTRFEPTTSRYRQTGVVPTEVIWRRCKCNWVGTTDQWLSVKPVGTFGFQLINHLPNVTVPLPGRLFFGIVIPFSEIHNFNCNTLQEYSGQTLSTGLDITLNKQTSFRVFLGVAETIVSSLLCCGVGIVQCLFNLLYYVIGVRNTKKPPFYNRLLLDLSYRFLTLLSSDGRDH